MVITTLNQSVMSMVQMTPLIPNHIIHPALFLPQSRPMTYAILSNLLHPLEDLHIAALSLVAPSSRPLLPRLELIIRILTQQRVGDPYPTLDLCQISAMTVSANRRRIQTTDNLGPMPTPLCVLNLCSAPLLSPTLKGPLIKDLFMQAENAKTTLGTGALNRITGDTIALTDELMSGPGLSTIDVTRLINVMETAIVSMTARVLVALRLLSTDKVKTVLPGTMMSGRYLFALRITNNHPSRMVEMTDGCHHHPSLLLCLILVVPLLYRPRPTLKGPVEPLPLTLRLPLMLLLLQFRMLLMTVPRDNLP